MELYKKNSPLTWVFQLTWGLAWFSDLLVGSEMRLSLRSCWLNTMILQVDICLALRCGFHSKAAGPTQSDSASAG
jgi:hypothetical protein